MKPQGDNFILGRAERLTGPIELASAPVEKVAPYSVDEAERRLEPQFQEIVRKFDELPDILCPDGETVAAITLHPEYIAKSYYPDHFLKEMGVKSIGSKASMVKPEKWAKLRAPEEVRSVTLFVRGSRAAFREIPSKLKRTGNLGKAAEDLVKVESVEPITDTSRLKPIASKRSKVRIEVVLHASADPESGFIIEGFGRYVESIGLQVNLDRRLFADGLCFLSMDASPQQAAEIAAYSFVRVVREMPQLRPVLRTGDTGFKVTVPTEDPLDPSIRVAVFDGGVPDKTLLDPWVRRHDTPGVGQPLDDYLWHGSAVTGALLFGPLSEDTPIGRPYCTVDHYRVLDDMTGAGGDEDLLDVLKRIQDVLTGTNYRYANLSLGPSLPVEEDNDPHAWTTILDKIFFEQDILAAVAIGNTGEADRASGNARIQPPSDCVNAMGIGAADTQAEDWKRAKYSSFGPGRAPGIVKPDVVAFGGSSKEPFYVVDAFGGKVAMPTQGTSFASPASLRTALGIRTHFGEVLSPIALKALLVHSASNGNHDRKEVGWGRVPIDFSEIVTTPDHAVRILYQGVLSPAQTIKAPIPIPRGPLQGMIDIKATITYFAPTKAQDSANYTSAGLDVVFRPHDGKKADPNQRHPDSKSFFSQKDYELFDDPLSHKAHTWETTRCAHKNMNAKSLSEPSFNLHYNARDGVGAANDDAAPIRYAMVITITAPRNKDLYNRVVQRYQTILEPLRPVLKIPVRVK